MGARHQECGHQTGVASRLPLDLVQQQSHRPRYGGVCFTWVMNVSVAVGVALRQILERGERQLTLRGCHPPTRSRVPHQGRKRMFFNGRYRENWNLPASGSNRAVTGPDAVKSLRPQQTGCCRSVFYASGPRRPKGDITISIKLPVSDLLAASVPATRQLSAPARFTLSRSLAIAGRVM